MPRARLTLVQLSARDVGRRVMLRASEAGNGAPPWTDLLGELLAADDSSLTVGTARGAVRVARTDVIAAKPVPPAPVRPGRP